MPRLARDTEPRRVPRASGAPRAAAFGEGLAPRGDLATLEVEPELPVSEKAAPSNGRPKDSPKPARLGRAAADFKFAVPRAECFTLSESESEES